MNEHRNASKLTEAQVREIYHSQLSQRIIASMYPVNQTCVSKIKRRETWSHLDMEMQTSPLLERHGPTCEWTWQLEEEAEK